MSYDLRPLGVFLIFGGRGEEEIEEEEGGFPICEVLKGIFGWLQKVVTPQRPQVSCTTCGSRLVGGRAMACDVFLSLQM